MHTLTVTLQRCEPLAEARGLPAESTSFTRVLDEGPWVQFTFQSLRTQDGAEDDVWLEDGLWWHNDQPWSDLVVEITQTP